MSLCLDANVFIDLLRSRDPMVRRQWAEALSSRKPVVTSVIVLHELESGLWSGTRRSVQAARVADLLRNVEVIDLTDQDVQVTGRLRSDLQRAGRSIGALDTLIAGQALARGWTIVTRNVRHFGRVEGLRIVDWAEGPEPLTTERIAQRVAEEA